MARIQKISVQEVVCSFNCQGKLRWVGVAWGLMCAGAWAGEDASPELDAQLNGALAASGANYRLGAIDTYGALGTLGTTIFFDDRSMQSGSHFVPYDPDRGGTRYISWTNELDTTSSGLTAAETSTAIRAAMNTWNAIEPIDIPLVDLGDTTTDLGFLQYVISGGTQGLPFPVADIYHAGFLPESFFETLRPGFGDQILATTAQFSFIDEDGNFTDLNGDGKADAAFREVYYNDAFNWVVENGGGTDIDLQTTALHEAGHGLSLDHFGKAFATDANGQIHFAPRSVMNAADSGPQQELAPTDIAAFRNVWGNWPNLTYEPLIGTPATVPEPGCISLAAITIATSLLVHRWRSRPN
ncbi:hypothetical protein NG895_03090 [Aeoliella sp. ICT_H6.2]|uniref:Matrixin n=1 Tax=Aeoliella straminimaris TaxID=2954799 RepID=A0A9X2JHG4_9BACT|nr:hypothetical protein [Aeoliella straminimaris]MCO6042884.1 hypothetical protein [Aeoliella straminimaris]